MLTAALLGSSNPSIPGGSQFVPVYNSPLAGWYVGFIIAAIVVTIVVILVAIILRLARKIGEQAEQVTLSLNEGRINTLALWDVGKVNDGIRGITRAAAEARSLLEARS